jgi:hypothetical protein
MNAIHFLVRYVVELKVGTGALYSLCAPTKECRTAWIEEIRRLKEALEPPTIRKFS